MKAVADSFGAKEKSENNEGDYIFRNNTSATAISEGGAFFGFISPDEEITGPFSDLSLVIFPDATGPWMVALGVGTMGFKNDLNIADLPGTRRLFASIINENGFCKTSISDIETNLPRSFLEKIPGLKTTLKTYSKVLPVCQIIAPASQADQNKIRGFIAAYAKIRDWPRNKGNRAAVESAIAEIRRNENIDDEREVLKLIKDRRFVILQGAPGTGKTRLAKKISTTLGAKVFFTQFHAETTYSDFIYGIKPVLTGGNVGYEKSFGEFYNSLKYAKEHESEKVILIIDEINRANLSNVLGPIFYLFEYKMADNSVEIEVGDIKFKEIPKNYFVIATMNTADRSLAVVDFALRRRFAWYILKPRELSGSEERNFQKDDFKRFDSIFKWYAKSEELALQPGQGYFIADSDDAMKARVQYELLPLVREYLAEGLLINAKEEFSKYFYDRIGVELFE